MTTLNSTLLKEEVSAHGKLLLVIGLALGIAVLIGAVAAQAPLLAIAIALAVPLMLIMMAKPHVATLTIIFILYANLAVVAVKIHGLPQIVGTMVPALLAIPFAHYLIIQRQKMIINPVLPWICLLVVIYILSALFSEYLEIAVGAVIELVIEGLALYFLINNLIRSTTMLRRVIWTLLLAGAVMGSVPIYQQLTGTFENNYWGLGQTSVEAFGTGVENIDGEIGQYRLAGSIGEQNRYAQIMLMLAPLAYFQIWGERSKWLRILAAICTVLIIGGGALAFSRGAAIAFALLLVVMGFMRYIKLYQLALILLLGGVLLQTMPQYNQRLTTLQTLPGATDADSGGISEADSSTQSRITEMMAAVLVFADHPVLGVGPRAFGQYYEEYARRVGIRVKYGQTREAHSLYPDIAAETGGLGLLCFLTIVFVALRNLALARKHWMYRRPELAYMLTGFMLAIIAYLTTGIFLHFSFMRFYWLILAVATAASYVANAEAAAEETVNNQNNNMALLAATK